MSVPATLAISLKVVVLHVKVRDHCVLLVQAQWNESIYNVLLVAFVHACILLIFFCENNKIPTSYMYI